MSTPQELQKVQKQYRMLDKLLNMYADPSSFARDMQKIHGTYINETTFWTMFDRLKKMANE